MTIDPAALRALTDDVDLMATVHEEMQDEVIDLRDRGIIAGARNGLAVFTYEGQPSPIIRMGTREVIHEVLWIVARYLEQHPDRNV